MGSLFEEVPVLDHLRLGIVLAGFTFRIAVARVAHCFHCESYGGQFRADEW